VLPGAEVEIPMTQRWRSSLRPGGDGNGVSDPPLYATCTPGRESLYRFPGNDYK